MAWTAEITAIAERLKPVLPANLAGRLVDPGVVTKEPDLSPAGVCGAIDHTLLKPTATAEQVRELCAEAREHKFASVCVNSTWVALANRELKGSGVKVCTVVGFPLGAMASASKAAETAQAVLDGADEIDMVVSVGHLHGDDFAAVGEDIAAVVKAADGRCVKVIIETSMLDREQKIEACLLSLAAKATFVKTSTGFGGGGATVEDVTLMRAVVGSALQVKASGGVRDLEAARAMIRAGANRLGTSSGVAIAKGLAGGEGY